MLFRKHILIILLLSGYFSHAQRSDFWNINFFKADSIADVYSNYDLSHSDKLATALTKDLSTDVEKFRAIFYWITQNISYDYKLYEERERKETKLAHRPAKLKAWQNRFSKRMMTRIIRKRIAICSGYSMLLDLMCKTSGISCLTISGYGRTSKTKKGKANHAWNAVQLNNKWYLCDPTWSSGYYDDLTKKFRKDFEKNYFLTDPSLLVANHFPTDTAWTLLLEKPTLSEFLNGPLKTDGYLANKINTYFPKEGTIKLKIGQQIEFKFTSNAKDIHNTALTITHLTKIANSSYGVKKNSEDQYVIPHVFEDKGTYEVAIYINGRHTFVYTVIVS